MHTSTSLPPTMYKPHNCLRLLQQVKPRRTTTAPTTKPRTFTTTQPRPADPAKETKVTSNYNAPPVPKPRGHSDRLPIFPLVAIFCLGSASFYFLTKARSGQGQSHYVLPDHAPSKDQWPRSRVVGENDKGQKEIDVSSRP
ncbi:hypothetical protein MBLNU230_g6062t1 [Neophaeotheca triangularis]